MRIPRDVREQPSLGHASIVFALLPFEPLGEERLDHPVLAVTAATDDLLLDERCERRLEGRVRGQLVPRVVPAE